MCTNHYDKTMMIENNAVQLLFFQVNIKEIGSLLVEKDDYANLEYLKMKLPLVKPLVYHYRLCHLHKKKIKYVISLRSNARCLAMIISEDRPTNNS